MPKFVEVEVVYYHDDKKHYEMLNVDLIISLCETKTKDNKTAATLIKLSAIEYYHDFDTKHITQASMLVIGSVSDLLAKMQTSLITI